MLLPNTSVIEENITGWSNFWKPHSPKAICPQANL